MSDKPRRFSASRVIGLDDDPQQAEPDYELPEAAEPVEVTDAPQTSRETKSTRSFSQPTELTEQRKRGLTTTGRRSLIVLGATLLAWAIVSSSSWSVSAGERLGRTDTASFVFPARGNYFDALVSMPAWGFGLVAAAAAAAVLSDLRTPTRGIHAWSRFASGTIGGLGAVLIVLAGARMLGFFLGLAYDGGQADDRAGTAVYLLAATGWPLFVFYWRMTHRALHVLAGDDDVSAHTARRLAGRSTVVALVALFALPLIPIASSFDDFSGPDHVTEPEAFGQANGFALGVEGAHVLAGDLAWFHRLAWATVILGYAAYVATHVGRTIPWPAARAPLPGILLMAAVPILFMAILTVRLYAVDVPGLKIGIFGSDDYVNAFNHVPALATATLAWIQVQYARADIVPLLGVGRRHGGQKDGNQV